MPHVSSQAWTGRVDSTTDAESFRLHQVVRCLSLQDVAKERVRHQGPVFAILGFCSDEGVKRNQGRVGAAQGPMALRKQLASLAVPSANLVLWDLGDVTVQGADLESAQDELSRAVELLLSQDVTPLILGGGHEMAFAHGRGVFQQAQKKKSRVGVINFDAHLDMRPLLQNQGHSGSPFLQLAQHEISAGREFSYFCLGLQPASNTRALYEVACQHKVRLIEMPQLFQNGISYGDRALEEFLATVDQVYLTVCLDVFDVSVAPGVSAPTAAGLTPRIAWPLLNTVFASGKVVSIDIAELNPSLDRDDQTARLGSKILWTALAGL